MFGIAVHTASSIAALADPGEILVPRTVVGLTSGSGLQFDPRGEHQLKGVPGTLANLRSCAERLHRRG
jgi:class 3 adenylate cyclase